MRAGAGEGRDGEAGRDVDDAVAALATRSRVQLGTYRTVLKDDMRDQLARCLEDEAIKRNGNADRLKKQVSTAKTSSMGGVTTDTGESSNDDRETHD